MLSTLPAVMAEIVRVCDDPNSSLSDLGDIIMHDPALTARMLKVVNSPFYGRMQEVSSIRQAVVTLGAARVKSLALSLSLYDLSTKIGSKINLKDFWRHSLNVSCVAEMIAVKVDPSMAEEAFICGCIHDIGMLVLDSLFPKEYGRVFQSTAAGEDILRAEQQLLEIDHATAGEMVARIWNFPPRYCETIAHHHDIFDLHRESPNDKLPQIINLADRLATFTIEATPPLSKSLLSNREVVASNLGLTSNDLREIEYEALGKLLEAAQFLDVDVGSPVELLQKSTSQLYELYSYAENMYMELKLTRELLDEKRLNKVALESLQAIIATFSHYLNNAVATISGRTQLLDLGLRNGNIQDPSGILAKSLPVYEKSVDQILSVIDKLKKITIFKTAIYHDNTRIIDFEKALRQVNEGVTEVLLPEGTKPANRPSSPSLVK